VLYLILRTPYEMNYTTTRTRRPRHPPVGEPQPLLDAETAQHVLLAMLALSVCLLLLPASPRAHRGAGIAATAAVLALAWNVTAQVSSRAPRTRSRTSSRPTSTAARLARRRGARAARALFGQSISDQNGLQILEFWNRSITHVWSLDGSSGADDQPGPRPDRGPAVPSPPETCSTSSSSRVDVVGRTVATHWHNERRHAQALACRPLHAAAAARHSVLGLQPDAWTTSPDGKQPAFSAYNRFATPATRRARRS